MWDCPRFPGGLTKWCGYRLLLRIEGTRWTGESTRRQKGSIGELLKVFMKRILILRGIFTLSILVAALELNAGPFQNGGFESPPSISTYQAFDNGNNPPGWIVESGTVEIVGPYWQAAEGSQSLDLNGIFEEIGTIYQDIPTVPGQSYRIRFAYAGNPECGPTVAVKSFQVFWDGAQITALQFDTTGKSVTNMGWQYYESVVTASGNTSRLRFKSTSPSFCGPTLDDISVTPASSPPVGSFVNGSFETPGLSAGFGEALPDGSTAITGWTISGTGIGWQNGADFGVNPVDGSQHIGFNGGNANPGASISQSFA